MKKIIIIVVILVTILLVYPKKVYYDKDFSIDTILSGVDCNQNGIDDYDDILLGARKDALNKVKYKSAYYDRGYPPEDEGVCTDLVWRAFKEAGYALKNMVDNDIKNNREQYHLKVVDRNIDFRRVENLHTFFKNNTEILTLDIDDIASWQRGDIVIFGNDNHIGIISDKRNKKGIPYLIHNAGQLKREEDVLEYWNKRKGITGHYRMTNLCLEENKWNTK